MEQYVESSVEIKRREQKERIQRRKRQTDHDNTNDPLMKKIQRSHSKLPPGWLDCPNFGDEIANLRLIPSKVPLDESFNDEIPRGKRYSYQQVIHRQKVGLKRKLGLVIDLTNSSRYYNVNDWKKERISHAKIPCKGRDSVPENEAVNEFVYEVSQFLAKEKNPKEYILVHCTHGHNRTGYMIVHYLVRVLRISVTDAIKMFADARPPGIYKPDYIEALYNFYHEEKQPDKFVCPSTPEWKKGCEPGPDDDNDGDNDEAFTVEDEDHQTQPVMTNDDVLGDKIPYQQEATFRHLCYQLLKLKLPESNRGQSRRLQFPGSHPVSLDKDNLLLLKQHYYYATWKADGTRYMMLITKDGCYLIDRHFNFRRIQMRFPCRPPHRYHHFTLLDGEMVLDKLPDTGKLRRRYLVYDMIAFNRISLVDKRFHERWEMLEKEVIKPRDLEIQFRKESLKDPKKLPTYEIPNPRYRYELEPFEVVRKHFWLLSTVEKILKRLIPQQLLHEADGLIFQGRDDCYVPLTHHGLLKWKFPEMNSVDFLFEMENKRHLLYLNEQGKLKQERNMVVFPDGIDPETCVGKIIECSWDSKGGVWKFMRMRPDKKSPNEFNTYANIMKSISDNITEDALLDEVKEIIKLPMYAESDKKHNERKAKANDSSGQM